MNSNNTTKYETGKDYKKDDDDAQENKNMIEQKYIDNICEAPRDKNGVVRVFNKHDYQSDYNIKNLFEKRVNTPYTPTTMDNIDFVVRFKKNTELVEKMKKELNKKASRYKIRNQDKNKDEDELAKNHDTGYLGEYALDYASRALNLDLKMIDEKREVNKVDFINVKTGDKIDLKFVDTEKGSNILLTKEYQKPYHLIDDKNKLQSQIDNITSNKYIHGYKSETPEHIYFAFECVVDINHVNAIIQMNNYGADNSIKNGNSLLFNVQPPKWLINDNTKVEGEDYTLNDAIYLRRSQAYEYGIVSDII